MHEIKSTLLILATLLLCLEQITSEIVHLHEGLIRGPCNNVDTFHGNVVLGYEDLGGSQVLAGLNVYSFSYWMRPEQRVLTFSLSTWPLRIQSNANQGTQTQTLLASQFSGVSGRFIRVSHLKDYYILGQQCRFGPDSTSADNSQFLDRWGFYVVSVSGPDFRISNYALSSTGNLINTTQSYEGIVINGISCNTPDFWNLNYPDLMVYLGSRYNQKLCGFLKDVKFLPGVYFADQHSVFQFFVAFGRQTTVQAYYKVQNLALESVGVELVDRLNSRNVLFADTPEANHPAPELELGYVFASAKYLRLPRLRLLSSTQHASLGYWIFLSPSANNSQVYRRQDRSGVARLTLSHYQYQLDSQYYYGLRICLSNNQFCVTSALSIPPNHWAQVILGFYAQDDLPGRSRYWLYTSHTQQFLANQTLTTNSSLLLEENDDTHYLGFQGNSFSSGDYFILRDFYLARGSSLDTVVLNLQNCNKSLRGQCLECNTGYLLRTDGICQVSCQGSNQNQSVTAETQLCARKCRFGCSSCGSDIQLCDQCESETNQLFSNCACPNSYFQDDLQRCSQYGQDQQVDNGVLLLRNDSTLMGCSGSQNCTHRRRIYLQKTMNWTGSASSYNVSLAVSQLIFNTSSQTWILNVSLKAQTFFDLDITVSGTTRLYLIEVRWLAHQLYSSFYVSDVLQLSSALIQSVGGERTLQRNLSLTRWDTSLGLGTKLLLFVIGYSVFDTGIATLSLDLVPQKLSETEYRIDLTVGDGTRLTRVNVQYLCVPADNFYDNWEYNNLGYLGSLSLSISDERSEIRRVNTSRIFAPALRELLRSVEPFFGLRRLSFNLQQGLIFQTQLQWSDLHPEVLQLRAYVDLLTTLYFFKLDLLLLFSRCSPKCRLCDTGPKFCRSCNYAFQSLPFCDCLGNRAGEQCLCPENTLDLNQDFCPDCSFKCVGCQGNTTNCTVCRGNRSPLPDCLCPSGSFEDGLSLNCPTCSLQCLECLGSASNCTVCSGIRLNPPTCACPQYYYSEPVTHNCLPCNNRCAQCLNLSENCIQCKGNRINTPNCICPAGYFDDGVSLNCTACAVTDCRTCLPDGTCQQCMPGRQFTGGECICILENCGDCQQIYFDVYLNNDLQSLTLDFQTTIALSSSLDPSDLCRAIFDAETYALLGTQPSCTQETRTITVALGYAHGVVSPDVQFGFVVGSIRDAQCPDFYQVFNATFHLPASPLAPSGNITMPGLPVSLCQGFSLRIANLSGYGKRDLEEIRWGVAPTQSGLNATELAALVDHLHLYNDSMVLQVFPLFLGANKTYRLSVSFQNYLAVQGQIAFTLTTSDYTSVSLDVGWVQTLPFRHRIWQRLNYSVALRRLDCSRGYIEEVQDASVFRLQIVQTDVNNNLGANRVLEGQRYHQPNFLVIEPYMGQTGVNYTLSVRYVGAARNYSATLQIGYAQSEFLAKILGGTRLIGHAQSLNLTGVFHDPDRNNLAEQLSDLSLTWACRDVVDATACLDAGRAALALNATAGAQVFPPGTLATYRTYEFSVSVTSLLTGKNASDTVYISVTEVPVPEFYPVLSRAALLGARVTMSQENVVEVDLGAAGESAGLLYSAALLDGQSQILAQLAIAHHRLKFRVRDHLSVEQVLALGGHLRLRVSVYDGSFLSSASILFAYDVYAVSGRGAALHVAPASGPAFTQVFRISVRGVSLAEAQTRRLQFRFSLYLSRATYDAELGRGGARSSQLVLQDFSALSLAQTVLPPGQLLLVGEILDENGSVFNVTAQLNVTAAEGAQFPQENLLGDVLAAGHRAPAETLARITGKHFPLHGGDVHAVRLLVQGAAAALALADPSGLAASDLAEVSAFCSAVVARTIPVFEDALAGYFEPENALNLELQQRLESARATLHTLLNVTDRLLALGDGQPGAAVSDLQLVLQALILDEFANGPKRSFAFEVFTVSYQKLTSEKILTSYFQQSFLRGVLGEDLSAAALESSIEPGQIYEMTLIEFRRNIYRSSSEFYYKEENLTINLPSLQKYSDAEAVRFRRDASGAPASSGSLQLFPLKYTFQLSAPYLEPTCIQLDPASEAWSGENCDKPVRVDDLTYTCSCRGPRQQAFVDDYDLVYQSSAGAGGEGSGGDGLIIGLLDFPPLLFLILLTLILLPVLVWAYSFDKKLELQLFKEQTERRRKLEEAKVLQMPSLDIIRSSDGLPVYYEHENLRDASQHPSETPNNRSQNNNSLDLSANNASQQQQYQQQQPEGEGEVEQNQSQNQQESVDRSRSRRKVSAMPQQKRKTVQLLSLDEPGKRKRQFTFKKAFDIDRRFSKEVYSHLKLGSVKSKREKRKSAALQMEREEQIFDPFGDLQKLANREIFEEYKVNFFQYNKMALKYCHTVLGIVFFDNLNDRRIFRVMTLHLHLCLVMSFTLWVERGVLQSESLGAALLNVLIYTQVSNVIVKVLRELQLQAMNERLQRTSYYLYTMLLLACCLTIILGYVLNAFSVSRDFWISSFLIGLVLEYLVIQPVLIFIQFNAAVNFIELSSNSVLSFIMSKLLLNQQIKQILIG